MEPKELEPKVAYWYVDRMLSCDHREGAWVSRAEGEMLETTWTPRHPRALHWAGDTQRKLKDHFQHPSSLYHQGYLWPLPSG